MIMVKTKFTRMCEGSAPVIAGLALCLIASVCEAQTPAQDAGTVAADKQAIDDAKQAGQKDAAQLATDTAAKNTAAVSTDTATLAADKLAEQAAEDKLKADQQQQASDDAYFNGTPDTPPAPAPAPATPPTQPGAPGAKIMTAPGAAGTVPATTTSPAGG
jgi:hypothetical protein